jgi:hypothetical protein
MLPLFIASLIASIFGMALLVLLAIDIKTDLPYHSCSWKVIASDVVFATGVFCTLYVALRVFIGLTMYYLA